ncbi:MAG: hypothetical protein HYT65_02725 [Candidatus Yanofskybacteria bacterium]|nr:hypothetical protein [Candidatus Yanofskybacteria bacterium]
MDIKKLIAINPKINNVTETALPYWWAFQGENHEPERDYAKNILIFFGNDMAIFRKLGVNASLYIKKCDECLDYLRKNFKNCRLCYKPHPSGKEEGELLNLDGFELIDDKINAELFLFQNRDRIRAVFSQGSASSWSAYGMGLNAYVFYKCFADICGDELTRPADDFFFDMPKSFFIKDFNEKIIDNAHVLKKDEHLESFFKHKLSENHGKIWLITFTVEHIIILIAMSKLIRSLEPSRKIGLIISRHSYWGTVSSDYFYKFFDEVVVWPRINYSLRPAKLWRAIQTVRQIKKFKISNGDILISMAQNSFVENCLNSYHKKNLRIGMIAKKDINLFYDTGNSVYTGNDNFRFSKASWFFNVILEPLEMTSIT